MILTVRDSGPNTFSSTADIYVSVTDLNDHPPEFFQDSYSVNIDEEQTYTTCVTVFVSDYKNSHHSTLYMHQSDMYIIV